MNLLTIVPEASGNTSHAMKTQGTKVLDANGAEIQGITRIELVAERDNIWRAKIECIVRVPHPIRVVAGIPRPTALTWWQRALCRLAGVELDTTDLRSSVREYARP